MNFYRIVAAAYTRSLFAQINSGKASSSDSSTTAALRATDDITTTSSTGSCNLVIQQQNVIDVRCAPPTDVKTEPNGIAHNACTDCIAVYYPGIFTKDAAEIERERSVWEQIRNGPCKTLCSCEISDVQLTNVLNVSNGCQINANDIDIAEIASNIKNDLDKFANSSVPVSDVQEIVTNVHDTVIQRVNQLITQSQTISVVGHGTISGATLSQTSDLVLSAFAQSTLAQSFINQQVDNLIVQIKQEVNKKIVSSLSDVFNRFKTELYIILGVAAALFVLYIVIVIINLAK